MACDLATLVSGNRLEGRWKSSCTFYAPVETIRNQTLGVYFTSLNSRWVGSGGGTSWQRGVAADNSKLTVLDNLSYQASVRPTIAIDALSFSGSFTSQKLTNTFNFTATDADDINYLNWQICAPTGECGPNYSIPRGSLRTTKSSQGLYTSSLQTSAALTLFIPGLGSPSGTWTLKLAALDTTWTWATSSFLIKLP
jgi:hypothetical protein